MPEILRGDVSPKWDHLCPRYLEMIFSREWDHLCPRYLEVIFSREWDYLYPRHLEMIFSREWDHLCPRYLGVMFHPSVTICAQNVRFCIEATLSVHGEIILPVCCFPAFPQLFAFPYTYFHLTCSFLLACRFSPKWDDLCPRYSEMIFFTRMGPSLPEILRGDFLPK